ncbi:MAG: PEP-CTERM sorting domain-containing protein [Thermoguttaceae bacterium]
MKKLVLSLATACCLLAPALAQAAVDNTTYATLLGINSYGNTTYNSAAPVILTGVVINNPFDMLDGSAKWQTYIQSLNPSTDNGGVALYLGKYHPRTGAELYAGDFDGTYDGDAWDSEIYRLMYSDADGLALSYGDVIQVTANAPGMFFNGKYNINEQHNALTSKDFTISVISRGTTPTAAGISLADLKNADGSFIFDSSRSTGCEKYQATLVHLKGLKLLSTTEQWASALTSNDYSVTVQQIVDGTSYTFDMILGLNDSLNLTTSQLLAMQETGFDLTAILDQEDTGTTITDESSEDFGKTYYTGGYRLWLTSAENGGLTVVPEPGTLALCLMGGLTALLVGRRRRSAD